MRLSRTLAVVVVLAVLAGMQPGSADPLDDAKALLCSVQDAQPTGLIPGLLDCDGDGFAPADGDCDDADEHSYPGAPHRHDGRDNDCDGVIDPDEEHDGDGDGFSNGEGDCNDADADVYPGAPHQPDGKDND